MYLTRMALNLARPDAMRLLSSPYKIHSAVEHAFPPGVTRTGDRGRILWRLDLSSRREGEAWLYVVSPEKPDLTHIVEQAGWPLYPKWETKDYEALLGKIEQGQEWAFRLKANPVRKVRVDKGRVSRNQVVGTLQGHVTVEQQQQWLIDRAERCGFDVCANELGALDLVISERRKEHSIRGGKTLTVATARYDGRLRVLDAEAFCHTLGFGIGHARSLGCGLMTVAPLGTAE